MIRAVTGQGLPPSLAWQPADDVYGQMMLDYMSAGWSMGGVLERDDGYVQPALPVTSYFAPYEDWPKSERDAIDRAAGRVLDLAVAPDDTPCGCKTKAVRSSALTARPERSRLVEKEGCTTPSHFHSSGWRATLEGSAPS